MIKNVLKNLFLIFGITMFIIGISSFSNIDYALLVVLGMISIALGWKYPSDNRSLK